jgi:hypothetical protein
LASETLLEIEGGFYKTLSQPQDTGKLINRENPGSGPGCFP